MKKLLIFVLLFFSFIEYKAYALSEPHIRCLEVQPNGDVLIRWTAPADISNLQNYELFFSTDNISFAAVATISAVNITYIHSANANTTVKFYYYLDAISTSGSRYSSSVISNIEFYILNTGNGIAQLNWNTPVLPPDNLYDNFFNVELKSYQDADYHTIALLPANVLSYKDTIHLCYGEFYYRILLNELESGCKNVSRSQHDIFSDHTNPKKPELDSVSVDFYNGIVRVGWTPPSDIDVFAYIVYYYANSYGWLPLDTVYGKNNTIFVENAQAGKQYRIASVDSCWNSSPLTDYQNVIALKAELNNCSRLINISWSQYQNMKAGIKNYKIYVSDNNAPLTLKTTVSSNIFQYTLYDIIPNHEYKIKVVAFSNDTSITASSMPDVVIADPLINMQKIFLSYASIVDNEYVKIKLKIHNQALVGSITLFRSINQYDNFELLYSQQLTANSTYYFEDRSADFNYEKYYYKAMINNDCNFPTDTSNVCSTILLRGESSTDRSNTIKWLPLEGWDSGIDKYCVLRKFQVDNVFSIISLMSPLTVNEYVDKVSAYSNKGGDYTYYVKAISNLNFFGDLDTVFSNQIVLYQEPVTFFANAFSPEKGKNPLFFPINSFVSDRNYLFRIYSRYGQVVFETKDPYQGWDGTCKGQDVPMGVYTYLLIYECPNREVVKYHGNVTLTR